MRMIVSMTTTPTRLSKIDVVLKTILEGQTRPPDKLLVHLPSTFARTGETYADPLGLFPDLTRNYQGVLEWVRGGPDYGPVTKLQGALQYLDDVEDDEDVWIVTIDDDIAYPPSLLETYENFISLWRGHCQTNNTFFSPCAIGLAGFDFTPSRSIQDSTISFVEGQKLASVLEGYLSVCYSADCFAMSIGETCLAPNRPEDVKAPLSWIQYIQTCVTEPSCRLSDDILISNWLALCKCPRLVLAQPHLHKHLLWDSNCILPHGLQQDALHKIDDSTGFGNHKRYTRTKLALHQWGWLAPDLNPVSPQEVAPATSDKLCYA